MTSDIRSLAVLTPDGAAATDRPIAVESPVAIEVNGIGYAVMMVTPAALIEFAIGFMLTERLADTATPLKELIEP